nr:MAG TPA_asm: hypothetical protein [Caudoviricetes sp.]
MDLIRLPHGESPCIRFYFFFCCSRVKHSLL